MVLTVIPLPVLKLVEKTVMLSGSLLAGTLKEREKEREWVRVRVYWQ